MKTTAILSLMSLTVWGISVGAQEPDKTLKVAVANPGPVLAKMVIPKAVFVIPASPREGQNPFFPSAQPVAVVQQQAKPSDTAKVAPPVVDTSSLVLNGITSPPRRMAMINGRTFEPGEEGEIRLPSGTKMMVKCLEIREDSAIVLAEGVRKELRLRFAL